MRPVTISRIDLIGTEAGDDWLDVRVDLRCGAGTYIRSVARDLGEQVGCGGYLRELRRTEAAGLRVADAFTPDRLQTLAGEGRLAEALLPPADLLPLPRLQLDAVAAERFLHGSALALPALPAGRHAVFDGERLLGIGTLTGGLLQPNKVLVDAPA
jgi:tRNA pseudouridine55 synthase